MTDVLVDTSVWSLAFRRANAAPDPAALELAELIREGRALILGLIRQELLSGVRQAKQFHSLRTHLRAFPDVRVETEDHEQTAPFCNKCRAKGVQGGAIDFLIAAVAARRRLAIFTTDRDFVHYSRVLGVVLHAVRPALD